MPVNFWLNLPKPFFVSAPMANVTDAAFRFLIAKYGKPDVMYTEFVSADGLCSEGQKELLIDLKFDAIERPIVAQMFSASPEKIAEAVKIIRELKFDGIDINMGCPDRNIEKQKAGASLINNPDLAVDIIGAAKDAAAGLPISVKTRLGFNKIEIETWLPRLMATRPAAIVIHARTRREMSKVPARWDMVARAVEIAKDSGVMIVGNGDVSSIAEARQRVVETGCDGVMIGRALFGNPWLFSGAPAAVHSVAERLRMAIEHAALYETMLV